MAKSGRTPIDKPSPTMPSEPLIRKSKTALCMERRTMLDHTPGESHYQSLIAEPVMVDGEPGILLDIATMDKRVEYYLIMKEVRSLSRWLTEWIKNPTIEGDPTMRKLRRSLRP